MEQGDFVTIGDPIVDHPYHVGVYKLEVWDVARSKYEMFDPVNNMYLFDMETPERYKKVKPKLLYSVGSLVRFNGSVRITLSGALHASKFLYINREQSYFVSVVHKEIASVELVNALTLAPLLFKEAPYQIYVHRLKLII